MQRKIEHSEVTRDALASMIETQRISKDQERAIAQKQLENLQKASQEENTALRENILELRKTIAAHR